MFRNGIHTVLTDNLYDPLIVLKERFSGECQEYKTLVLRWLMALKMFMWINKHVQRFLIRVLSLGPVPGHVSFIMDGNRRYAKSMNMPIKKGHEAGGLTLLSLVYACKEMGVRCVSAYAFSIENFNRSKEEVDTLNNLFAEKLEEFANRANDYHDPLHGTKLRIVGDLMMLSKEMQDRIAKVEDLTKDGDQFTLYICYPYTSRNEIYHAICVSVKQMVVTHKKINIEKFTENMYLDSFSNHCDLLIRTSGHRRLSDYMLWQSHSCSTINFNSSLWPDFTFYKLFVVILTWSYYTTIVNFFASSRNSFWTSLKTRRKHVDIDSLPPAPVSISITGKHT